MARRKKRKGRYTKKQSARLRRKNTRRHKRRVIGKRAPGLSPAQIKEYAVAREAREARHAAFSAARDAIADRMGVSRGHAQAHYQALIEHHGMSPADAEEATWGFQY